MLEYHILDAVVYTYYVDDNLPSWPAGRRAEDALSDLSQGLQELIPERLQVQTTRMKTKPNQTVNIKHSLN
ncbi:Uncharacterized protein HZ326_12726 [Fusarium oxysporum f. sp. albedinis]|nr:Uncharacterized protein HZ326_12726 [Fusarium oxysporum f. sp. albedinis]